MNPGQLLLLRVNGELRKGIAEKIYKEDIDIRLQTGEIILRKFWEIRKIKKNEEEKYKNIP